MVLARAAIDAQDFDVARTALAPLLGEPTQRVCLLMAELEASEHGDVGKAREWTARAVRAQRDPAWVADGVVSERWLPVSPLTGKLDAFEWKLPPGLASTPMLENEAERVKLAIAAAIESREASAREAAVVDLTQEPATPPLAPEVDEVREADEIVVESPAEPKAEPKHAAEGTTPKPAPVFAMPHLPDDPGPEPIADDQPRARRPFGL